MSSPTEHATILTNDSTSSSLSSIAESPTKPPRSRRRSNTSSNSSVASTSSSHALADHGRTIRAGLNFPVGLVGRSLKRGGFSQRIGGGAPVYVAAVLEYLATEVLDLAGHAADLEWRESGGESSDTTESSSRHRTRPTKTITPAHIEHAIRSDGELQRVMQDITEVAASAASAEEDQARMSAAAAAASNTDSTELDEEEEEEEDEGSQGDEEDEEEEDGEEEDSQGGESQTEPAEMEQIENDELETTTTNSQSDSTVAAGSITSTSSSTTTTVMASPQKRKSSDVSSPSKSPSAKRPKSVSSQIRPKPAAPLFDGTIQPLTTNGPTTNQQQPLLNMARLGHPIPPIGSFSRPVLASAVNAAPAAAPFMIPTAAIAAAITPPSSLPAPVPVSASPFTDNLVALSSVMPGVDLLTCSRVLEAQQNNLAKAILFLQQQQQANKTSTTTPTQTMTPTPTPITNYND